MATKKELETPNIENYITEKALDALYVIEGHDEFGTDNLGIPTTYYGLRQTALDELSRLEEFGIKKPKDLIGLKVNEIDKKTARKAAAYLAVMNTKKINKITGNDNFIRNLDVDQRSAILIDVHNTDFKSSSDNFKNGKYKDETSYLKAIQDGLSGNQIIKRFLMSSDNLLMSEIDKTRNDNGRKNRILDSITLFYNPDADFSSKAARDKHHDRYATPNYVKNTYKCINLVDDYNSKMSALEECANSYGIVKIEKPETFNEPENPGNMNLPKDIYTGLFAEEDKKERFLQPLINLYNGLKNIFNNGKEKEEKYNFVPFEEQIDDRGEKFTEVDKNVARK